MQKALLDRLYSSIILFVRISVRWVFFSQLDLMLAKLNAASRNYCTCTWSRSKSRRKSGFVTRLMHYALGCHSFPGSRVTLSSSDSSWVCFVFFPPVAPPTRLPLSTSVFWEMSSAEDASDEEEEGGGRNR